MNAADVPQAKLGVLRRYPVGKIGRLPLQSRVSLQMDQLCITCAIPPTFYEYRCLVFDLSGQTDCCGGECKLFHVGSSCVIQSSALSL